MPWKLVVVYDYRLDCSIDCNDTSGDRKDLDYQPVHVFLIVWCLFAILINCALCSLTLSIFTGERLDARQHCCHSLVPRPVPNV